MILFRADQAGRGAVNIGGAGKGVEKGAGEGAGKAIDGCLHMNSEG